MNDKRLEDGLRLSTMTASVRVQGGGGRDVLGVFGTEDDSTAVKSR